MPTGQCPVKDQMMLQFYLCQNEFPEIDAETSNNTSMQLTIAISTEMIKFQRLGQ